MRESSCSGTPEKHLVRGAWGYRGLGNQSQTMPRPFSEGVSDIRAGQGCLAAHNVMSTGCPLPMYMCSGDMCC